MRRLSQGGDSLRFALEHSFASAAGVFAPAARSFGLVSAGVESPSAARLERVSQLELLFCRRASSAGFGSRLRPPSPFWSSSVPLEDTGPEHASSEFPGLRQMCLLANKVVFTWPPSLSTPWPPSGPLSVQRCPSGDAASASGDLATPAWSPRPPRASKGKGRFPRAASSHCSFPAAAS